ncbi:hypothetical protein LWI28_023313 [Acer negundo]|uniref:Uncharacterized protein n=1 Tax=Acer negundo TaxID=4023 RepID=A0AAD5JEC1_ACENE|nr:hypothetical protein LWI28_023313 [Acer negundo]
MSHNRRGRGGFRMEGRDNDNNDMEEIKKDNPFNHHALLGKSDERERGSRPFNNDTTCYFDLKVDILEFERTIQLDEFIGWLNPVEQIFDYKEVSDEINFNEPPIFDNYQKEGEEITWNDHGESLVIRRVMNAGKAEDGPNWLRHNIFHTKRIASGKVCHVIIDSGNCENIMSQDMDDKLHLKTKRRLESYRLPWTNKGNDVVINQRCLMAFLM